MNENEKDIWERILNEGRKQLITEGWTPPSKEPEPEFKPGDYCKFRDKGDKKWRLGYFLRFEGGKYYTKDGVHWDECLHAPTWIKWETGEIPGVGQILVQWSSGDYGVSSSASGSALKNKIKRWARLPGVE